MDSKQNISETVSSFEDGEYEYLMFTTGNGVKVYRFPHSEEPFDVLKIK